MNRILTAMGLLTIVGQSSLTIAICNIKQTKQIELETDFDAIVVSAINQITDYQLNIEINVKISYLNSLISEVIKEQLSKAMKNLFNKNLFTVNRITNDIDEDLLDVDLQKEKVLNVHINYDYGEFENQNISLIMNIHKKGK
ncbi:MAG: hypothetical protein ACRC8P_00990 [Spiroplasma sp.]